MLKEVQVLTQALEWGKLPRASKAWGGANVVVAKEPPSSNEEQFGSGPRYVLTPHVLEVSAVLEKLAQVAKKHPGFGVWKEEFFGRIGNAATAIQEICPECTAETLVSHLLETAQELAAEIDEKGGLETLLVAPGSLIFDDIRVASDSNRYLSAQRVQELIRLVTPEVLHDAERDSLDLEMMPPESSREDSHDPPNEH